MISKNESSKLNKKHVSINQKNNKEFSHTKNTTKSLLNLNDNLDSTEDLDDNDKD